MRNIFAMKKKQKSTSGIEGRQTSRGQRTNKKKVLPAKRNPYTSLGVNTLSETLLDREALAPFMSARMSKPAKSML